MIKLRIKDFALVDLQLFVRNYEQAFFELYSETGLWNEELIIQSYRQSAQKIYLTILQEIETRLTKTKVLGRKQKASFSELIFYTDNRLVIVYYSEAKNKKERLVESISIDRKPIIF